jgi:hypothetical protein
MLAGMFVLAIDLRAENAAPAAPPPPESWRGSKVEWTRLQTHDDYWNRHSKGDLSLLKMMRENTSLEIAAEWKSVKADDLPALCRFPFIFAADLATLKDAESKNLAEYLKRGGFLMVDCCINPTINRDPRWFLQKQLSMLARDLPGTRAVELTSSHELFSVYFKMPDGPPMDRARGSWSYTARFPFYAVMMGDRMLALISLHGMQCSWDGSGPDSGFPEQPMNAMKMATNIYLYAMMR